MDSNKYFSVAESEQFTFYRVPKILFTHSEYQDLSAEGKLLYGLYMDRMELFKMNKWIDENGHVFIYFSIKQVCNALSCGREKAAKLFCELEKTELIIRKKQGQGNPDKISVLKFSLDVGKTDFKTSENQASRSRKNRFQEAGKLGSNNTELNDTDYSDINLSISDGIDEIVKDKL